MQKTKASDSQKQAQMLFEHSRSKMYAIAYRILGNSHDSEDAVMEAFKRILKNASKFEGLSQSDSEALGAIYVKHTAIDIYNSNLKRAKGAPLTIVDELYDHGNDSVGVVASAISSMPASHSSVILLKYHYGYSNKEIASALGITEISVRKRLERAKKELKEILKKEGLTV